MGRTEGDRWKGLLEEEASATRQTNGKRQTVNGEWAEGVKCECPMSCPISPSRGPRRLCFSSQVSLCFGRMHHLSL